MRTDRVLPANSGERRFRSTVPRSRCRWPCGRGLSRREESCPRSHERVQDNSGWSNGKKVTDEVDRLLGDVLPIGSGRWIAQQGGRVDALFRFGHRTVRSPHDVLQVVPESALHRPSDTLVPHEYAAPRPATGLHRVSRHRKLPPVREHVDLRGRLGDAPRLRQPQRTPAEVTTLVSGVTGERAGLTNGRSTLAIAALRPAPVLLRRVQLPI